jgi:hypothetical protein
MLGGVASRLRAALQDVDENAEANTTRFAKELAIAIPRLRRCCVVLPCQPFWRCGARVTSVVLLLRVQ